MTERVAGLDKRSHDRALGRAMREVPNMKMNTNGEIRDRTTMQYALHHAESRHLCVSELHASKAIQAVQRILNIFRETAQRQLLMNPSLHTSATPSPSRGTDRMGNPPVD